MTVYDIFDPKAAPVPIGIDLGTTNSLVAYVKDGRPRCVTDCDGEKLVPSVVQYGSGGQVLVGREAVRFAIVHPAETIASVKRLLGKGADDPETKRLSAARFVPPKDAAEAKTVRFDVRGKAVQPIEVSAEILKALVGLARDELHGVGPAVITVPAYFDDAQRQATKDAARLAGIDVLRLLNEPTAAALAYGLEKGRDGLFAVYDLGGGTFDVTILSLDDGVFHVRATGGDSALGGDDFDRALAEAEILPTMGFARGEEAPPEIARLALDAARRAKHALTDVDEVVLTVPRRGAADAELRVTRARFEALVRPFVERTVVAAKRALRDAELEPSALDGVILVGGATRVPLVREVVEGVFGKAPLADIDPDEVVALGAALSAELLAGEGREDVLLLDVLPLSLGVETMGGVVDKILPRNTTLPASAQANFTTYADNQTGFDVHVVQGERELAGDCRSLARFLLRGIPPMPAGMARLRVVFAVDADGLLHVTATELTTGLEQRVEVKPTYGLTDEQVEEMLLGALDHGEADLEARRLADLRVEASRIVLATKKGLEADRGLCLPGEAEAIEALVGGVEAACEGDDATRIRVLVERLDEATHGWAGRRMDAAIARAIGGRSVDAVEGTVAHADGLETKLAREREGRIEP